MIRITLLYRDSHGARFDFDYYLNHHVVMTKRLLADYGLIAIAVQKCLHTLDGGKSALVCITHVDFETEAKLNKALDVQGATLMADFQNYTNIDPEIYVCELLSH